MGLASKLAAQAGGTPASAPGSSQPYPSYQQQQQQQQQQQTNKPANYPGQPQYQPYPGQPGQPGQQYGAGPGSQQYGGPPQQQYNQQPQYGAQQSTPQVGVGAGDVSSFRRALEQAVQEKGLQRFYPPGSPILNTLATAASQKIPQLCQHWKLPAEVGRDMARLGLYDIILFVDDSGSMQFEENGERIDDLRLIIERVAYASTLFDPDGISIRFMNTDLPEGYGDNIRDNNQVAEMMMNIKYSGLTPMGRQLKRKVVDGIVLRDARAGRLKKPVLVIIVTDGQPAGDDAPDAVFTTVRYAVSEMARAVPGSQGAISFQFCQVGNDTKAREFLGRLDSDSTIGSSVDVTSNFEQEQEEMRHQTPPVDLTPDLWCVKLLLGSIDPSYDSKDEVRSYRPGGGRPPTQQPQYGQGPQSQYAQGPPGQYGHSQPGQYGQPNPGQYGAPQGHQAYNAQQPPSYGAPSQQQPPYGYNQPPQQGRGQTPGPGYGQQPYGQQSYSQPPPPPRY